MKTYLRLFSMLLVGVLCFSISLAHAITSTEKENNYEAAERELITYLNGDMSVDLLAVSTAFGELKNYGYSSQFFDYVSVLIKISDEEYDIELDYLLNSLKNDEKFNKNLDDLSIGTLDDLEAYARARENEHKENTIAAIENYENCNYFLDAKDRLKRLRSKVNEATYTAACKMMGSGNLAGAYYTFAEISKYNDSASKMAYIIELLGCIPIDEFDNLAPVTGLKVTNIATDHMTLSWQKSSHARQYEVYFKETNQSESEWKHVADTAEETLMVTELKQGTSYDFKVVASIGRIKADETVLSNQKTASVTPTPKPTPTPTPKPTITPEPIATDGLSMLIEPAVTLNPSANITSIAVGVHHIVGLRQDGSVVAIGRNDEHQCDTKTWKDIIAIDASDYHTVGLRKEGTVLAVGKNWYGECDTDSWDNIIAIAAGNGYTVGLRKDGTVVAVGRNNEGQCETGSWKDIVAIAAGDSHTIALQKDGTLVAVGYSKAYPGVDSWKDIVAIAACDFYTVGLRKNGTVVAVGLNALLKTDSWKNIVAVSGGAYHLLGLRMDGTVVAVGSSGSGQCDISTWLDIVAVSAGGNVTVGLQKDGTVVAVGDNYYHMLDSIASYLQ